MRRSALCLLAMLAAVAMTGCGSEPNPGSLEQAATNTGAETSRIEMTWGDGKQMEYRISGRFDYVAETGLIALVEAGDSDAVLGPHEVRFIGDDVYGRWAIGSKTYWVREDSEPVGDAFELLVPVPAGASNPTTVLPRVLGASAETKILGEEQIRGAKTTRYRAKVDLDKVIAQLPPEDRPEHRSDARFVPLELWIDEESRLRRMRLDLDSGDGPALITTVELFDFGVEVDVDRPPADQLISQDELDRLIEPPAVDSAELQELCEQELEPELCAELRKGSG